MVCRFFLFKRLYGVRDVTDLDVRLEDVFGTSGDELTDSYSLKKNNMENRNIRKQRRTKSVRQRVPYDIPDL